ncbi:MAG: hypothetical protein U5L07_07815 [Desulfobacterales bacterium]|nr:hypothetical protein [Desulfobacterales bacterium]
MENERLKYEGRLAEKRHELRTLKLKINSLRDSVRANLDPFEAIEHLNADAAAETAVDLAEKVIQYRELIDQIGAIERALGRG